MTAEQPPRRDVLVYVTRAAIGFGALAASWPFVAQWAPNPATPMPESTTVDLTLIEPGATMRVTWREKPWLVRHRTQAEILRARVFATERLPDRWARNPAAAADAPATTENRTLPAGERWLVVSAVCPHDACVLQDISEPDQAEPDAAFWCPCDGSRFDSLGRVLRGPAGTNLVVPPATLLVGEKLKIG